MGLSLAHPQRTATRAGCQGEPGPRGLSRLESRERPHWATPLVGCTLGLTDCDFVFLRLWDKMRIVVLFPGDSPSCDALLPPSLFTKPSVSILNLPLTSPVLKPPPLLRARHFLGFVGLLPTSSCSKLSSTLHPSPQHRCSNTRTGKVTSRAGLSLKYAIQFPALSPRRRGGGVRRGVLFLT